MWQAGLPRQVRLRSINAATPVEATVQLSQVESNVDVADAAFDVEVPAGVEALTLDELRQAGPLRER
jgi:outer membrane lipoprotein-sorting protein